MLRAAAVVVVLAVLVCATEGAHAQPVPWRAVPQGPTVVTFSPTTGDTLGGDAFDPLGPLALQPLRLGMFADPETPGPHGDPDRPVDCTQSFSAITGASAFGMQHALRVRLAPKLTLYGFSRGGCPRDVGGGFAMTYVQPISKDVFFVLSGGAIYLPYAGAGSTPVPGGQIRADFAIRRSGGRAWFVGVGSTGRHSGVTFSGTF